VLIKARFREDGMKLIIQVPCLNEEESLPVTLAALPREVPGFDVVEWLVIDDGSTDRTAEVARACGADHVVRHSTNLGLARAFMTGIEAGLQAGADVIVNTDADNQYFAGDIPALVAPILEGKAQIVIGARPITDIETFSPVKKLLQAIGSGVVRMASGTDIPDAPSGFRAYHKDAAAKLFVLNAYTYTLETIIQAGRKGVPMTWVPVRVNAEMRPSRLVRGIFNYVRRSALTIVRISLLYSPVRFFTTLAAITALPGLFGVGRFLFYYLQGEGGGRVQSLVLSGALLAMAMVLMVAGVLADLIAANRALLEDIRARQLRAQLDAAQAGKDPAPGETVRTLRAAS
jgi:glycosyltransferase involved in cell wall biosynthesis